MPDFNIENLKKTWQEHKIPPKYQSTEIEAMLHKSSRNYVKYILGISIAEFVIILIFNLYYLFTGGDSAPILNVFSKLGVATTPVLQQQLDVVYYFLKVSSLLLSGYFIYRFYQNYIHIKIESDLKKLILQIIKFKKTVNFFILANIGLMIAFMVVLGGFIFYILSNEHIAPNHPTLIAFYVGFIISTILSVLFIWIYYRIVYGILLKRLEKNLNELEKIEKLQA